MLKSLSISNFAVILSAQVDFGSGLNILTGETGAGKSIIIDAINVILGNRVSKNIIRSGMEKARAEALFEVDESVKNILEEFGIECEDNELLISREVNTDGKNKVRINGSLSTVSILKEIGELLINIHGQHDNQALLHADKHIDILDGYVGDTGLLAKYKNTFAELKSIHKELEKLNLDEAEKIRLISILKYETEEIANASLKEGEIEELTEKRNLLQNSQKILENTKRAYAELCEADEYKSATEQLQEALRYADKACGYDESLKNIRDKISEAYYLIEDASAELGEYAEKFDFSNEDINYIEKRFDEINKLKSKYGSDYDEINKYYEKSLAELEKLEQSEINKEKLESQYTEKEKELKNIALEIRKLRKEKGAELSKRIVEELSELNMPNVVFQVNVIEKENFNEKGMDDVEFLISANAGQQPGPLSKIASGGELSRVMLAIKSAMFDNNDVDTLIFDEIDTGVSGRAAQKIAEKLYKVSLNRQVLCVTHLPQIAAMSDNHYLIEKNQLGEKVETTAKLLSGEEKTDEIARIIGGVEINENTKISARDMLVQSCEYKLREKNG